MKNLRVLLIDANKKIHAYLSAQFDKEQCEVFFSDNGKNGLLKAFEVRPHIIIIDGSSVKDTDMESLLQRIKKNPRFQNSQLISFTKNIAHFSEDNYPFDEVFPKTNPGLAELVMHIEKYIPKNASSAFIAPQTTKLTIAKSIVFVSAKGGTGLSTVCSNAGAYLQNLNKENSVAIMSLSEPYDSLPLITGLNSDFNLMFLNEMNPVDITPFFLKEKMKPIENWGIRILPGIEKQGQIEQLSAENFQKITHAFRYSFDYVFTDLGNNIHSRYTKLLTSADIIVVVLQPDPVCVAQTKKLVQQLKSLGVRQQQLMGIFNHVIDIKGFVTSQIEETVDLSIRNSIPNFGELKVEHYTPRPIYLRVKNEYLTLAFRQIALEIQNKAIESYQNRLKSTY